MACQSRAKGGRLVAAGANTHHRTPLRACLPASPQAPCAPKHQAQAHLWKRCRSSSLSRKAEAMWGVGVLEATASWTARSSRASRIAGTSS